MVSWQYEAQRANLSTVTLLSDPPRYKFRGEEITYGPFLHDEADAFVMGLMAGMDRGARHTAPEQPSEADIKLAAVMACAEIVKGVEPGLRSNLIHALAWLFGITSPVQPQRPMRNYLEVLQRTRSRIIAASNESGGGAYSDPWLTILAPLNATIAEAEAEASA